MPDLSSQDARASLSLGPQLPYTMGRFTLCEELGAGGMATVYLSKMKLAAGLERLVAVKTIHSHLAKQQTFVDMFLDEAKIASHISHPNVCAVYDFGDVGGIYYIAMEYLVGEPLIDIVNAIVDAHDQSLLENIPFLSARIIADSCEGLHAAHSLLGADGAPLQVIHRDVSPQNLFVTYEGAVKVVDFGCAKALERVTQTNTGVMKGKVSYAAPEQLQGREVDARLDVFALGVCLWECLTLRNLFRRDNAILTAQAVLSDDIPRADDGCPWVPRALADIADKALQRDKEQRYKSARDMGRALRAFIAGSGVTFESAEVADFMELLFSDRRNRTLQKLADVKDLQVSQVGRVADTPVAAEDHDLRQALVDAPTKLAKTPASGEPNVWEIGKRPDEDDPVVLPTRTTGYVMAVLVLLTLVGGGVYAYAYHGAPIFAALGVPSGGANAETPDIADGPGFPLVGERSGGPDGPPANAGDPGTAETNTAEANTAEANTAEANTAETNTAETNTAETNTAETNTAETNTATSTTVVGAPTGSGQRRHAQGPESVQAASQTAAAAVPTGQAPDHEIVRPTRTLDFSQGTVQVVTTGGFAIVEHDGRRLGRTPLRTQLPVGRQTLRLLPNGEGPAQTVTVQVAWGEVQQITVPLGPATEGWDNPY